MELYLGNVFYYTSIKQLKLLVFCKKIIEPIEKIYFQLKILFFFLINDFSSKLKSNCGGLIFSKYKQSKVIPSSMSPLSMNIELAFLTSYWVYRRFRFHTQCCHSATSWSYIGWHHINPITFDTFLKTLLHKKSNFRSRRIKLYSFVVNDLSFQLNKSDLNPHPPFLSFSPISEKIGLTYNVC